MLMGYRGCAGIGAGAVLVHLGIGVRLEVGADGLQRALEAGHCLLVQGADSPRELGSDQQR